MADVNEIITFTLRIVNTSGAALTNVVIADPLPAGMQLSNGGGYSSVGVVSPTIKSSIQAITFTAQSIIANGKITLTVPVKIDSQLADGATLTNQATFNAQGVSESASAQITVHNPTPVTGADAVIVKEVNQSQVTAGELITYSIWITNVSGLSLNNLVITDILPANLWPLHVQFDGNRVTVPTLVTASDRFTSTVQTVEAGGSIQLTLEAYVDGAAPIGSEIRNTAYLRASNDSNLANNSSSASLTVIQGGIGGTPTPQGNLPTPVVVVNTATPTPLPQNPGIDGALSIRSHTQQAILGDVVTYTVELLNIGQAPLLNLHITDTMPSGAMILLGSYTSYGGIGTEIAATSRQLTLNADQLPVAGKIQLLIPVLFDGGVSTLLHNGGTLINPVEMTASNDTNPANNRASSEVSVQNPASNPHLDLEVKQMIDPPFAKPGDPVSITYLLKNTGKATLVNIVGNAALPSDLTFINGAADSSQSLLPQLSATASRITVTVPAIGVNGIVTTTIQAQVKAAVANETTLTSLWSAIAEKEATVSNNQSTATLLVTDTLPQATLVPTGPELSYRVHLPLAKR